MKKPNKSQPAYLMSADLQFKNGFLAHQNGLLKKAEEWYRQALQVNPRHTAALHLLGIVYAQWGHYAEAVKFIAKAAELVPNDFSVQNNLANALIKLGKNQAAVEALNKALRIKPDSAEVWNNRGNALYGLGNYTEALNSYDQSLLYRPDYAEALCNKANALIKLARFDEALETVDKSLLLDSSKPVSHNTKGNVLYALNKLTAAFESFDESLRLRPEYALSHYGRGLCLIKLNRINEAIHEFELTVAIDPSFPDVYPELSSALFEVRRFDDAMAMNDKAIALNVKHENILGARTLLKTRVCNWTDLDNHLNDLFAKIKNGEQVALPFHLLSVSDDLALHRQAAEIHLKNRFPRRTHSFGVAKKPKKYRIKIGYYSADFHDHATMRLMAEFFELHNRKQFEIFAFSFGPATEDAMRKRAVAAFDQFIDVNDKSDTEIAELSRQMGVDIAVDLKGYTGSCRPGIFAARAAPVQVNYHGYPGTMGKQDIDYILADPIVIPDALRSFYAEKVVQLPHTYQVNDRKKLALSVVLDRASCGLPEKAFVYCCFNNNFKMTAAIFGLWMRVLHRVPDSVLWLFADNATAEENLTTEALAQGIGADQLVFAHRVDYDQNLARQPLADLFLDTFPYNAHTTASDALWAGLPVLTLQGQSFAARVGSSLLHAAGLPELVTTSQQAYEELAVKLALEPGLLTSLRARLHDARATAPLFDTPRLTRDIEKAYRAMYDRFQAVQAPDHLVI